MHFVYFYLISYSIIGYGILLSNYLDIRKYSFGYLGILGLSFLLFISFGSSMIINHSYLFNLLILILGLIFFFIHIDKINNLKKNIYIHLVVFTLLLLFITISKNHDDFSYYHFPYISILTEFSHPLGIGLLNNGFRSPSSAFFIGSMFYLPGVNIYLFHITPAFVLGFSNLILIQKIFNEENFKLLKFTNFISLISLIFINIFFYRLAEHGTDRSGMILVIISFILFIKVINLKYKDHLSEIKFLIISLCFAITLKPFYLINIPLILLLLLYDKTKDVFLNLFFSKTFWYCLSLIFFIIFYTFINSGCLFFPLTFTCFGNLPWSMDLNSINDIKIWFELWSKAGASPNFVVDDRIFYISDLNWIPNWIHHYFFNKVSDFLLGLLLLLIILTFVFRNNFGKKVEKKISFLYLYILLVCFLLEWFFNHPTLRYGGYHLVFLSIFIPFSIYLTQLNIDFKTFERKAVILIFVTVIIFSFRNFDRLYDEYKKYDYNPLINFNYKFIGGDKEFHYRYNFHLRKKYINYNSFKILGKNFVYLTRKNF
tara:strand:- start:673 stop:2298 length:1626 start_codon:yes stop_codon:yes gene_type:complete